MEGGWVEEEGGKGIDSRNSGTKLPNAAFAFSIDETAIARNVGLSNFRTRRAKFPGPSARRQNTSDLILIAPQSLSDPIVFKLNPNLLHEAALLQAKAK